MKSRRSFLKSIGTIAGLAPVIPTALVKALVPAPKLSTFWTQASRHSMCVSNEYTAAILSTMPLTYVCNQQGIYAHLSALGCSFSEGRPQAPAISALLNL